MNLERARHALSERLAFDDSDESSLVGLGVEVRAARWPVEESMRAAPFVADGAPPHSIERLLHVVRGGTVDAHRGVAPSGAANLVDAGRPLSADADAARDPDRAVHDEKLAVVARYEPEPPVESRPIEQHDFDAGGAELTEKPAPRAANTDPVEQDAHGDASLGRRGERRGESVADVVGAEDEALQRDRRPRALDERQHRVERRGSVAQQGDAIATRHVRRRDSPEAARERRPALEEARRFARRSSVNGLPSRSGAGHADP